MSGREAALLRLRQRSKKFADDVERLDISHRVRARSAANWRLINEDDFIEKLVALYAIPQNRAAAVSLALCCRQRLIKNVVQERRFSRTRNSSNCDQHSERNFQINVLQIMGARSGDAQLVRSRLPAFRWTPYAKFVGVLTARMWT